MHNVKAVAMGAIAAIAFFGHLCPTQPWDARCAIWLGMKWGEEGWTGRRGRRTGKPHITKNNLMANRKSEEKDWDRGTVQK